QLGNVQQALQPRLQLDEDAEVRELRDLALLDVAGVVTPGDVALPRVVVHLLQAQRNALALLVHVEDDAGDLVALADHLAGVGDLAHPAHVADVQEAVDALLDLDEGAVVGQVADHARDDRARRVALGHLVPRAGLHLLHAQGDFLLLLVDVQDLHLDLVADGHQLAGVVDALGPAHLGDVDEALDARLELDEGAVAHDVDDLAGVAAADRVLRLDVGPRARRLLLQAQGDLLLVLVHRDDEHVERLIDVDHLVRVGDAAPAHVGDVQQAVDAAQVHEGAELGDVLDDAAADLAGLDLVEQLLLHLLALVLEELAAADDDVAASLVDLEDLALDGAADVVADVGGPADVHLAGRQEDVD